MIKPIPSAFDIWAMVAAGSALFAALRELYNRKIDHGVPTVVIAFWGAAGITLFGTFFAFTEDWRMFAIGDLIQLFVASVFVGIAIYLMALGFRNVDLSVVAPFRYSYLITSALGGYLVFGELPDGWSIAGRRPDRGQRSLRVASRGGEPACAHRKGVDRRLTGRRISAAPAAAGTARRGRLPAGSARGRNEKGDDRGPAGRACLRVKPAG